MSPSKVMLLFDGIILFLGLCAVLSGMQMKRTRRPAQLLLSKEELLQIKDAEGFAAGMYGPTLIFGAAALLYAAADCLNRYFIKILYAEKIAGICFLIVCIWFVKKFRERKAQHFPDL